ncbi:3-deoxy-7-phosphoheptulonate synthase [Lentzea sp. NBC_00516]|uniref:3-deoxy-7-phosphoheptulonate synthase n=1 Tax=Lentzea sp. NBC_00516 TaxID=2903582 RepID=UPI002E8106EA|nr:3-deoxy-7-phosphoheptulonate synthase [Lentzea sp. NBC_00516]WUD26858.1 3-deoxy-7-phosphoheptulonate synthase [Lentzea sp. NBC_00516]
MTAVPAQGVAAWNQSEWSPSTWRDKVAAHQPDWPDSCGLTGARLRLASAPPLTTPEDIRSVRRALAEVAAGRAYVMQGGDCAEPFGFAARRGALAKDNILGVLSERISRAMDVPVLAIARLAGQFAKPRSEPTEVIDGEAMPTFRGLAVNSPHPVALRRVPDVQRMVAAYHAARAVMSELRGLARRRNRAPAWIGESLGAVGDHYGRTRRDGEMRWRHNGVWVSHEALLLDYEEALVRFDPSTGGWYLTSTHFPWIGERTRAVDGAHVEFMAGIGNPVGCKIGPGAVPEEVVSLCARLDPEREPGRLTLICRLGAHRVRTLLPPLVRAVRDAGHPVVWMCDPMHGNTRITSGGVKTRHLDDIAGEAAAFHETLHELGQWPGGVHLELAGEDVTECVGGSRVPDEAALTRRYTSLCDPRLNNEQALLMVESLPARSVSRL